MYPEQKKLLQKQDNEGTNPENKLDENKTISAEARKLLDKRLEMIDNAIRDAYSK